MNVRHNRRRLCVSPQKARSKSIAMVWRAKWRGIALLSELLDFIHTSTFKQPLPL